jgi:hypothetical protein
MSPSEELTLLNDQEVAPQPWSETSTAVKVDQPETPINSPYYPAAISTPQRESANLGAETTNSQNAQRLEKVVLKDSNGLPTMQGHDEAVSGCKKKGMRLPTIRELAYLAAARGAKGVVPAGEIDVPREEALPKHIVATNSDGESDDFFYSPMGFRPDPNSKNIPVDSGEGGLWLQGHWFWSSSTGKCELDGNARFCAFVFDAYDGEIGAKYNTVKLAVTCVGEKQSSQTP